VTVAAAAPVEASEFTPLMAAFGPFEARPNLAVAVSGGRDSLSLALLAHDWARVRDGNILALIVDHGLRPEAAREAARTRELLAGHGIASEILRWTGAKPSSGLQAAARAARYRLLLEACRRHGLLHLLVAHQADDQRETVAMRADRASGPDGLAGMAPLAEQRDVRLLRPLLAVPRTRLTATLQARGVLWIDDPSNLDARFERGRLRAQGGLLPRVDPGLAGARASGEREFARVALHVLEFEPDGLVALDRAAYMRLGQDNRVRLLGRLAQALGGRDHPPRRDRLARAALRLVAPIDKRARGKSGKGQDFTLSGLHLMLRQVPGSRRLRWIVGPESGKNDRREGHQPLIPAAFFACEPVAAPHLE